MKMKYIGSLLCFLLLTCATNKENTSYYSFTQENNININYSINDSQFVGNDFITYELTSEQKEILIKFLTIFESTDKYVNNIIQKTAFRYEITKIDLFWLEYRKDFDYGFYINFYSTEKLTPYSRYDDDKEYWRTFNIALFRIEDDKITFIGWYA